MGDPAGIGSNSAKLIAAGRISHRSEPRHFLRRPSRVLSRRQGRRCRRGRRGGLVEDEVPEGATRPFPRRSRTRAPDQVTPATATLEGGLRDREFRSAPLLAPIWPRRSCSSRFSVEGDALLCYGYDDEICFQCRCAQYIGGRNASSTSWERSGMRALPRTSRCLRCRPRSQPSILRGADAGSRQCMRAAGFNVAAHRRRRASIRMPAMAALRHVRRSTSSSLAGEAAKARASTSRGLFLPDTVFLRARNGAISTPCSRVYHDQGQIAMKLMRLRPWRDADRRPRLPDLHAGARHGLRDRKGIARLGCDPSGVRRSPARWRMKPKGCPSRSSA